MKKTSLDGLRGDWKADSAVSLEKTLASCSDLNTLNLDPVNFFAVFKAKSLSANTNSSTATKIAILNKSKKVFNFNSSSN